MAQDYFSARLKQIGELDDYDQELLSQLPVELRQLSRGEEVSHTGEEVSDTVAVVDGMLQAYSIADGNSRQITALYFPTDIPSLETIHMPRMDTNLGAITASVIALVPHAELHRVMERSPRLRAQLWRLTLVQASIYRGWLTRNSQLLAHQQMAHFFCEMLVRAEAAGQSDGRTVDLPLTQQDIADVLGMTPVHCNRTLMMLRSAQFAEFRGGVLTVLDRAGLMRAGEFDPTYLHLRDLPNLNEAREPATV